MKAEFKVDGLDRLDKKLKKLPQSTQKKVIRRALSESLRPTLREIRSVAPRGNKVHKTYLSRPVAPGFLARNIRLRIKMKKGYASGSIVTHSEAFYGFFLNYGTESGTNKKGNRRGKGIKGNKFASRTFKQNEEQHIKRFSNYMKFTLNRLIK